MNLTSIVLEEVTVADFNKLQQFWNKRINIWGENIYSRIRNPLRETNYERLLFQILEQEEIELLCVRDGLTWLKRFTNRLKDSEVRSLAAIASRDKFKRNYLEAKFRKNLGEASYGTMEFTEYRGEIVGYDLRISHQLAHLFTIHSTKNYCYNHGLWIPEDG